MPGALQTTHLRTLIAGPWRCSLGSAELLELRNATPPWPAHVAHSAHAAHAAHAVHAAVLGVLNVRAQIVPVLDLALLLQTAPDLLNAERANPGGSASAATATASLTSMAGSATGLYALVQAPARLLALRIEAVDDALVAASPRLNLRRLTDLLNRPAPPQTAALARRNFDAVDLA